MNTPRRRPAAAPAALIFLAAGALAGCTSAAESGQSAAALPPHGAELAAAAVGDAIRELTHGVNWAKVESAPTIEGF